MHVTHECYAIGYVSNGNLVSAIDGSCANRPSGGVWFTVRVEVSSDKSVNVFLNNVLVRSLTAHYNTKGRGGVLVANGNNNIVQFKNFNVASN